MTANAFPHSAMSRRNSEVVRGQGQSSDCYGFFAEHDLPLSLAACDTDSMAWPHMTFSNADQDTCATADALYTKALQIAALESLTNALDYGQLPTGKVTSQHVHSERPFNPQQPFGGPGCSPQSLDVSSDQQASAYTERSGHAYARLHELLASANARTAQPAADELLQARRPHWAGSNWHPKAGISPSANSGTTAPKGTGVFLPCAYEEPDTPAKLLSRSLSDSSNASRDCVSPRSELSRIDSSFSCHSSETDCSYIAAHGLAFPSMFPAGDARRVVGSKIGLMPSKRMV